MAVVDNRQTRLATASDISALRYMLTASHKAQGFPLKTRSRPRVAVGQCECEVNVET